MNQSNCLLYFEHVIVYTAYAIGGSALPASALWQLMHIWRRIHSIRFVFLDCTVPRHAFPHSLCHLVRNRPHHPLLLARPIVLYQLISIRASSKAQERWTEYQRQVQDDLKQQGFMVSYGDILEDLNVTRAQAAGSDILLDS